MNVLSLCDGMSCGLLALNRAGIKVDKYFSSEIKDIALMFQRENYLKGNCSRCKEFIQIGDVNKVSYKDGTLYWSNGNEKVDIDLVCFGSPCQTFSIGIPTEFRVGLQNKVKSGLFFECKRVLDEVNPTYFLMENVYSMKKEDVETVTNYMGVKPVMIDGVDYSPAIRKRWYWTNIPLKLKGGKDIQFIDILEEGWSERKKARCLAVIDSRPNSTPVKMFHRYYSTGFTTLIFKSEQHYKDCVAEYERQCGGKRKCTDTSKLIPSLVFDGVRYMTKGERCACQGVDFALVKCLTDNEAADLLGDGWQVDVIADIFGGIENETNRN